MSWHHKRSKYTLQTSNCGTGEFHKQELVPAPAPGWCRVSAVVHTGQRGQVFSRVSTNCRVGFFNFNINTVMTHGSLLMQTTRQLGEDAFIAKIINRLLKYLSTQNGANVVYFSSSDSVNINIEEPYGSAVGCWLVGSGPGRGDIKHSIFQLLLWLCSCCGL